MWKIHKHFLHTKCTHMRKVAASSTPPPVCSVNPASCFFGLRRVLCWLSPPGRPLPTPGDQQPARHIYLSATGPFSEFTQIPLEYGWENKQSNSLDCSGRLALAHALSPLSLCRVIDGSCFLTDSYLTLNSHNAQPQRLVLISSSSFF